MRVIVDADARQKAVESILPWLDDDLGEEIEQRARRYAPKDTGALAASCEHHLDGTTLIVSALGGAGGRSYAAYIELGHRVFHPTTGIVGPEWVPAQPFLRPALYGGAASVAARMFREDVVMQRRVQEAHAAQRHARSEAYREDLHRRTAGVSEERRAKWLGGEQRRAAERERNKTEDWRTFTRNPATGEKIFMEDAAKSKKEREAAWFAEQWKRAHPGEPRDEAPPF